MLKEIRIENLAVIRKAMIPFCEKLNVFTGETGAGKSILLGGIHAILGQRVTRDIVRNGADRAVISALFTDISDNIWSILHKYDIKKQNGADLILMREILADGGSVARVNGKLCSISLLKEVGSNLINIHGQHDNQTLLLPDRHMSILDGYAGLNNYIAEYQVEFRRLQELARLIKKLDLQQDELLRNQDLLRLKANEINNANLSLNEDIEVENAFKRAQNSELILQNLSQSSVALVGNGEEPIDVCSLLRTSLHFLSNLEKICEDIDPICERIESVAIEVQDISSELFSLSRKFDFDTDEYQLLINRREEILKLKDRYGPTLNDVIESGKNAEQKLEQLDDFSNRINELKSEKGKLLSNVTDMARKLSRLRDEAADSFVKDVSDQLAFLDMSGVKLEVARTRGKLTITGMDSIEFMLSANIGEPPKSISKIASGGELSRIMLAIKNVIAKQDDVPTLIFDEIDTGVSGRAAQKIGIKLAQIAQYRQVICVTHLAQIAIQGDEHLYIEKNIVDGRTETNVEKMDLEGRKHEIARIISGDIITPLTLQNAEELLQSKWRAE